MVLDLWHVFDDLLEPDYGVTILLTVVSMSDIRDSISGALRALDSKMPSQEVL